jgi:hypothetical protein
MSAVPEKFPPACVKLAFATNNHRNGAGLCCALSALYAYYTLKWNDPPDKFGRKFKLAIDIVGDALARVEDESASEATGIDIADRAVYHVAHLPNRKLMVSLQPVTEVAEALLWMVARPGCYIVWRYKIGERSKDTVGHAMVINTAPDEKGACRIFDPTYGDYVVSAAALQGAATIFLKRYFFYSNLRLYLASIPASGASAAATKVAVKK